MCSPYIAERHIIALMARELKVMQSLERRGLATLILITAGFNKRDVADYVDAAIESERARRLALWGVVPINIERKVS